MSDLSPDKTCVAIADTKCSRCYPIPAQVVTLEMVVAAKVKSPNFGSQTWSK